MAQIDTKKAELRKRNIKKLLIDADLTWLAFQDGAKLSSSTINRIKELKTNLSKSNRRKIETFFGLKEGEIDLNKRIELPMPKEEPDKDPEEIPYLTFKNANKANLDYSRSKSEESKAAEFVRIHILKDPYFEEKRKKSEIIERLKSLKKYKKSYKDLAMAKEIERMHNEDKTLKVETPFGNKSVFLYYREKTTT
ncbi:hypothetical protein [Algoriphagus sp. Y33]|uniref:hypothetical protein n=1 Tax=Algoriphagus sp. Y33 TaxID=2772483 RepID=UPI001782377B|nr:hypothetical protein [Algoriphagus sp. Y33]